MRDKILKTIDDYPKHYSRFLKKDPEIMDWLAFDNSSPFAEFVYNKIYPGLNICVNGNTKKFDSIVRGYKFCGRTGVCECARKTVSEKVSQSKQSYNKEEKDQINEKRYQTNLEKYGVENAGQSEHARKQHQIFYASQNNIKKQLATHKQTMMDRYGVENAAHLPHVMKRLTEKNPMVDPVVARKSAATRRKLYTNEHFKRISYLKLNEYYKENCNIKFITPIDLYEGVSNQKYYDFECISCDHTFSTYIDNGRRPECKICNPTPVIYKSREELEVFDFVKSLGVNALSGDRSLINPYELDILIPDNNIAIEYCGLYWHSELSSSKHPKYHQDKFVKCNDKGIRLITIFSDEWKQKQDIVKSVISAKLGIFNNKLMARKCSINELSNSDVQKFHNKNHIQGHINSLINIGLVYDDSLVSVASFSKSRFDRSYEWELTRFTSLQGTTVTGGFSRLLNYFIKNNDPDTILSYADLRYGNGNVYKHNKFKFKKMTSPGYSYTRNYEIRESRYKYQKKKLPKTDLSEWKYMQTIGYDRIWDCGNNVWVWNKEKPEA